MAINWITVASSNIAAIAWSPEDGGRLHVRFNDGRDGHYVNAPRSLFDDMLMAGSKGVFHHRSIRMAGYVWVKNY